MASAPALVRAAQRRGLLGTPDAEDPSEGAAMPPTDVSYYEPPEELGAAWAEAGRSPSSLPPPYLPSAWTGPARVLRRAMAQTPSQAPAIPKAAPQRQTLARARPPATPELAEETPVEPATPTLAAPVQLDGAPPGPSTPAQIPGEVAKMAVGAQPKGRFPEEEALNRQENLALLGILSGNEQATKFGHELLARVGKERDRLLWLSKPAKPGASTDPDSPESQGATNTLGAIMPDALEAMGGRVTEQEFNFLMQVYRAKGRIDLADIQRLKMGQREHGMKTMEEMVDVRRQQVDLARKRFAQGLREAGIEPSEYGLQGMPEGRAPQKTEAAKAAIRESDVNTLHDRIGELVNLHRQYGTQVWPTEARFRMKQLLHELVANVNRAEGLTPGLPQQHFTNIVNTIGDIDKFGTIVNPEAFRKNLQSLDRDITSSYTHFLRATGQKVAPQYETRTRPPGTRTQPKAAPAGKIMVSNGTETFLIAPDQEAAAAKDGFRRVQ